MVRECKRCGALNEDVLENCVICAAILPRSVTAESRIRIDRRGIFSRGIDFIRYAMPLFIVEEILYIVVSPFQVNLLFDKFSPYYSSGVVDSSKLASSIPLLSYTLIAMIAISIVAFILMRKGFSMMRIIDSEYKTGVTGTYLLFVGLIILIPGTLETLGVIHGYSASGFALSYLSSNYLTLIGGAALLILGGIFAFIGYVMVCLAIFKLGARFNYGPVKIGGVLLFLLSFLGGIVLLFSLRTLRSKILGVKEEFS